MVNKKSGAKKKKERQAEVQRGIRSKEKQLDEVACNQLMHCESCDRDQRNRAFCYFCSGVIKLPMCAECGRTKCVSGSGGDCLVKHPGIHATGMQLVGCICDFCEAWVCHSRKCVTNHTCPSCPLEDAKCLECTRGVDNNGGRFFRCATCEGWLCEDDQFEHQASCQYIDSETYACVSCSRFGTWACLKCKLCWCDLHKEGAIKAAKGDTPICKKCRSELRVTKDNSVSTRSHKYGRQSTAADIPVYDDDWGMSRYNACAFDPKTFTFGGKRVEGLVAKEERKSDDGKEDDVDNEEEDDGANDDELDEADEDEDESVENGSGAGVDVA